jgi:predicted O-methyltransferase YrrM
MHRRATLCALALTILAAACAGAQPAATRRPPARVPDVPFVPTPREVVDAMLAMARVGPNDVLYDLGSGDGRIVIAAAKQFGTRGVGYDIDPARIREANVNARRAGVTDKVRFVLGDIFDADISEATVVTLYLLPEVNLQLRPKLLRELRPGTRVVSHRFDMGDWVPERRERVEVHGADHFVFFWTIPPRSGSR